MKAVHSALLTSALIIGSGVAFGQATSDEWFASYDSARNANGAGATSRSIPPQTLFPGGSSLRDSQGLPGVRPRLSLRLPAGGLDNIQPSGFGTHDQTSDRSAFSWSLEAWQLNTASLAHIQCSEQALTATAFLASDCRFVDQPAPDNALNLVQVRGEWMASPNVRIGMGAFVNPNDSETIAPEASNGLAQGALVNLNGAGYGPIDPAAYLNANGNDLNAANMVDGVDINLSFGIRTDYVGDFLIGLQLARYRQRLSLGDVDYGLAVLDQADHNFDDYAHSAQLALGWQLGNFRTDLMGQHRQAPMLFSSGYSPAEFSSFDLEFSWQPRNGSLSIGVSNVLDAQPRSDALDNAGRDESLDGVFGRIPYVRYKHDL